MRIAEKLSHKIFEGLQVGFQRDSQYSYKKVQKEHGTITVNHGFCMVIVTISRDSTCKASQKAVGTGDSLVTYL